MDRYEYTHTNDRMWRKTRKPYGSCYGLFFQIHSKMHTFEAYICSSVQVLTPTEILATNGEDREPLLIHVSLVLLFNFIKESNICITGSETYRGPNAFSEPETNAIQNYVLSIKTRVAAYFAVHSYGQYWLYPWVWLTNNLSIFQLFGLSLGLDQ